MLMARKSRGNFRRRHFTMKARPRRIIIIDMHIFAAFAWLILIFNAAIFYLMLADRIAGARH